MQSHRLRPPPLPSGYVDRVRLTTQVLTTEPGGACLISAAPGYGATTAMAAALAAGADAVAWVGLDARCSDQDARRLLSAAVAEASSATGVAQDVPGLLSQLASAPPMWLAVAGLDPDRHPGLADDLIELAAYLPASTRLLVSSHSTVFPIIQVSGARAVALNEAHLQFDADEAVDLLRSIHPGIDIELITNILAAAEGWAAALVSAAAHARDHSDDADWITRSGPDELFHNWFVTLPDPYQAFLAETTALELLSVGPADAVRQRHDSGALLSELDSRHAHIREVTPPAGIEGRCWSRHGLLTRYLRRRSGPDWPQRHSRAADWFQAHGDVDRTMHHLMAAGRTRDVGAYLIGQESDLLGAGKADKVLQWYEQLPTEMGPRAMHLLRLAWGQTLSGDLRGADALLGRLVADLSMSPVNDDAGTSEFAEDQLPAGISGEVALLRAYLASFRADPATMIEAGSVAVAEFAGRASTDARQLAPLLVVRGLLWSGQSEAAQRALDQHCDQPFPTALLRESNLTGSRALVAAANGSIHQARVLSDAALTWLERQSLDPLTVLQYGPLLARGMVHLESGELSTAHTIGVAVAHAAEGNGHLGDAVNALALLARIEAARGDLGAALRTIAQARNLATTSTPTSSIVVPLDQLQARLRTSAGDLLRAERLIRSLPASDIRSLLFARVALLHQPAGARRTLEALQPATPLTQAERHLLLASSYLKTSRRMAEGHLRRAAMIAHESGLGLLLAHSDTAILELANDTALHNQDDAIVWLLQRRQAARVANQGSPTGGAPGNLPALSRGELQLLALLPSRASNAAIADTLGVSVNTIKTRLRRLYAKLDVSTRDEAVARATSLGVIRPD